MVDKVARALEQTCFAVLETTRGTLAFPTVAAELIAAAGDVSINQQPSFTNSGEIINSLDVIDRFQDQAGPGTFEIPTYFHPSGTPGAIPMAAALYKSLMGLETIVGGTSVTYSQALEKPSVSIWLKGTHSVFFARGACVEAGKANATNKGGAGFNFSGGFMELGWAGTDVVVGAVSVDTAVIVSNAKLFTAGARVRFDADTNTNAGYEIASIDYDTDTLTMSEAVTVADAAVIAGFLPTGFAALGEALENRKTAIKYDGAAKILKSLSIDIGSPVQYQIDEITPSNFPEAYVEDRRAISGTVEQLFRASDLAAFYDGYQSNDVDVDIIVGEDAGEIVTISLPYAKLEVPSRTSSAPTVSLSTAITALGSGVGENSCTIAFT